MSIVETQKTTLSPLLDACDSLRDILGSNATNITLPSLVVVGDQSSGKSSVLEGIAGVDLPRGGNIVTRVPLVLRLRNGPKTTVMIKQEGSSDAPTLLDSTADVNKAVSDMTNKIAGSNLCVVDKPIHLSITSPASPDLTVVDLPGLTHNTVADQPPDTPDVIRRMIFGYVKPETAIILCIIPSTVDFATSEAIKIARLADPELRRTIGVITKMDRCEAADIAERINGSGQNSLHMPLGFYAVRNRSPEELRQNVTPAQARDNEKRYFLAESRGRLQSVPMSKLGVPSLCNALTELQLQALKRGIPKIRDTISQKLAKVLDTESKLPPAVCDDAHRRLLVSDSLTNLGNTLFGIMGGAQEEFQHDSKDVLLALTINDMTIKMAHITQVAASKYLTEEYAHRVRNKIRAASGTALQDLLSRPVMVTLVKEEIVQFREPINDIIVTIRDELLHGMSLILKDTLRGYPRLLEIVQNTTQRLIHATHDVIRQRSNEQLAYEEEMYTIDPRFMLLSDNMFTALKQETSRDRRSKDKDKDEPARRTFSDMIIDVEAGMTPDMALGINNVEDIDWFLMFSCGAKVLSCPDTPKGREEKEKEKEEKKKSSGLGFSKIKHFMVGGGGNVEDKSSIYTKSTESGDPSASNSVISSIQLRMLAYFRFALFRLVESQMQIIRFYYFKLFRSVLVDTIKEESRSWQLDKLLAEDEQLSMERKRVASLKESLTHGKEVLDSLMMGQSRKEDAGMWGMFEGSLTALKTKVTG